MIELLGGGAGPTAEMYVTMGALLVLCFLIGTAAVVAAPMAASTEAAEKLKRPSSSFRSPGFTPTM